MARKVTLGPRYVVPSYTVAPQGSHGCAVLSTPAHAASQVACYLESRPGGACDVTYSELCGHCRGNGRVPGKRRLSWRPCKACNGEPEVFSVAFSEQDVRDLMRRYQSAWLGA